MWILSVNPEFIHLSKKKTIYETPTYYGAIMDMSLGSGVRQNWVWILTLLLVLWPTLKNYLNSLSPHVQHRDKKKTHLIGIIVRVK